MFDIEPGSPEHGVQQLAARVADDVLRPRAAELDRRGGFPSESLAALSKGNVLSEADPVVAGENAERAIDPRNAWIMTSLLKDVIRAGTATRALSLNRSDLSGKTGTTNENVDAWFCGYNNAMVGVAWIGFDQPRTLGTDETGGKAALPIWIAYMAKVLKGTPDANLPMPSGVVALPISAETGLREEGGLIEYFFSEFPPRGRDDSMSPGRAGKDIRDQLF